MQQSAAITNAVWAKAAGGTGVTPVVTDNFALAPDGSMTATRIQLDIGSGTTSADISMVRQIFVTTLPAGQVWIKLNSGSDALVRCFDSMYATATSTWQKFSFPGTAPLTDARLCSLAGNLLTAKSIDILVWRPQLEDAANRTFNGYQEYVSTGLTAPWHGGEADGVQYFLTTPVKMACWGDSLTTSNSIVGYPQALRNSYITDGGDAWIYEGGVGGQTSTQIMTRMIAAPAHYTDSTVIWAGRNNFTDPTTVKADIATMVAALGHTRFLVMSVLNMDRSDEWIGTTNYNILVQLNADLAALYPNNYFDIRAYLVSQYDPNNSQDVIDHGHDVSPSTLRATGDMLHLNTTGYGLVAARVKAFIASKGWPLAATAN